MQHQPQLPVNNNDVEDCLETPGGASEDSILSNLATRYSRNQVFSSLGSNAILAVNPKRTLESFSDACSSQYVTNGSGGGGGEKQQLAAHVFQLAERAFNRMTAEEQDQSIILM